MSKVTLNSVADITQSSTAQTTINTNFTTVQTAFDNTLSRDGTSPNQMSASLDMNSFDILNLPSPATVNSPARLVDVVTNPTITVPPVGVSGATVPLLNGANTWSGQNTYLSTAPQVVNSRTTVNYTPVFDLAGGALSVATLYPNISITVPAAANWADIRFTAGAGTSPTWTVGAGSIATNICCAPIASASCDVSSNVYGSIMNATNAGPGTVKGIHGGVFGSGTSTGVLVCFNGQVQPVATQGATIAFFSSLTSSGVNNKAVGLGIESNGDQYGIGIGNTISALPIGTDYIRWWQAASSAAGANFLNLLASDGVTTNFKVDKFGNIISIGTLTSSGFSVNGSGIVTGASYKVSTNQVVGARATGYTAMTGTPNSSTAYATSTVTLPQLAGRIMQLQADLTAHGLIGT